MEKENARKQTLEQLHERRKQVVRLHKKAMDGINQHRNVPIEVRQVKYLNNIIKQDHRFVKRVTKPMLGFKSFRAASAVLAGIELMHMIRKGQMSTEKAMGLSFAKQFYALAA